MSNISLLCASYVLTPTSHNSFNSSIKGSRNTSMSLPGALGPGINNANRRLERFIHIQGEKLYRTSVTGHMLYLLLKFTPVLNPSVDKANRIFCESAAKSEYNSSKCFHALESAGCLISPSSGLSSLCQRICLANFDDINILLSLEMSGKWRRTN
uniref:Uncharacterized protein n=1 Tax=Opuntia streptacantha TaxID=393608 RepID=A0A7C8ZP82_OPUST